MTTLQTYNGMDTIATFQLWQKLQPLLDSKPHAKAVYDLTKDLRAPLLYAMMRGILVDTSVVEPLRQQFEVENNTLEEALDAITKPLIGAVINLASPVQVKWLLECLDVDGEIDTDRQGLEKVAAKYPDLAPVINIITAWRDRAKMLTVLQPTLYDKDNRMRCTYKPTGTETGRLSSSKNCLWTGMNMQNIKREEDEDKVGHASIRSMFVADPGFKFCNIDLERADSWAVGLEVFQATGDDSYLNACGDRDLHTYVAQLVWPNLGWTGDPTKDKAIAEQFFYRQYDYRFMCKKGGHGSNYLGSAWGLASQMKIPVRTAEGFQAKYFKAFPGIPKWHQIKAKELQTKGHLTNLFGRRRNFHGRPDQMSTLREAIAYLGQSVTAEVMNRILLKVWQYQFSTQAADINPQFLAQVHDSGLWQFHEEFEAEFISDLRSLTQIPITVRAPNGASRTISIPVEVAVGWNWAKRNKDNPAANPDGLINLKLGKTDDRQRTKFPPVKTPSFMDRRVSSLY